MITVVVNGGGVGVDVGKQKLLSDPSLKQSNMI